MYIQTVFNSQLFTEGPNKDSTVTADKLATLKYVITNVAVGLPLSLLPSHLCYTLTDSRDLWRFHDSPTGVIDTPTPGMTKEISVQAVPSKPGALSPPRLTLRVPRVGSKVDNSGYKGADMVLLTPAQVYEKSLGETVTVVVG